MSTSQVTPTHENLFAVEEIVTFRNVYLVRAASASNAMDSVALDEVDSGFQQHVFSHPSHAYQIKEDADIVRIMNSTEQPTITLEEFTARRDSWLKNCVHEGSFGTDTPTQE